MIKDIGVVVRFLDSDRVEIWARFTNKPLIVPGISTLVGITPSVGDFLSITIRNLIVTEAKVHKKADKNPYVHVAGVEAMIMEHGIDDDGRSEYYGPTVEMLSKGCSTRWKRTYLLKRNPQANATNYWKVCQITHGNYLLTVPSYRHVGICIEQNMNDAVFLRIDGARFHFLTRNNYRFHIGTWIEFEEYEVEKREFDRRVDMTKFAIVEDPVETIVSNENGESKIKLHLKCCRKSGRLVSMKFPDLPMLVPRDVVEKFDEINHLLALRFDFGKLEFVYEQVVTAPSAYSHSENKTMLFYEMAKIIEDTTIAQQMKYLDGEAYADLRNCLQHLGYLGNRRLEDPGIG